jgi:hypothetical protein
MLALIVSPCYGDTETFLGKPLSGTMADWDKCQIVSTLTSNDTYHTECTTAPEKCTGEYIRQHGNDTGVSYCSGNKLAAAKGEESKTPAWVLPTTISVAVAVVVVVGLVIFCKKKSSKNPIQYSEAESAESESVAGNNVGNNVGNYRIQEDSVREFNTDPPSRNFVSKDAKEVEQNNMMGQADASPHFQKGSATTVPINHLNIPQATQMYSSGGNFGGSFAVIKSPDGEVSVLKAADVLENVRRRLLQDEKDHPQADDKNTRFLVLNDHVTVPNEEIHKRFTETISEYTGKPPLDLHLPSARHNRKMLANDTAGACGYVKITPPATPGGNFIYAQDPCETFASENIMSFAFLWDVMKIDQNGNESYDPSWLALTKNDPRLSHPADANQHKDVLSWVHAEEQQVVAYPYRSFGNLLPYTPAMDADYDQNYEGSKHLQIKAHLNKIAHPELWDVSVGGGGDIFSRGTMTTLYEVMDRVQTVTAAAKNGDYISYSGEFQHSTLRNPQRVCAGAKKAFEWKNNGVQGGNTDVLFKETRNYCGNSMVRPAFGIPPKKLLMDTGMHMYAGLSNVKAAIFAEFVAAPGIRTRKEWYRLSKISLDILWGQIQALNFMWTPVTGQQREPEYPTPK